MEVDVIDGGGDIVLKIHLSLTYGGQFIQWIPTRTKMAPVVLIIWLAQIANGKDMLESVNNLSDLAQIVNGEDMSKSVNIWSDLDPIQHYGQRIKTRGHEPLRGCLSTKRFG